jgi:hypothetical protein
MSIQKNSDTPSKKTGYFGGSYTCPGHTQGCFYDLFIVRHLQICMTMTGKSITLKGNCWVGRLAELWRSRWQCMAELWRSRWQCTPPPDRPNSDTLAFMIDCFAASGGPFLLWHLVSGDAVALPPLGAQGGWGPRGQGWEKAKCGSTILSGSWEAAVSHMGKTDYRCNNGSPVHPWQWGCKQLQWERDGSAAAVPSSGGNSNSALTPAEMSQSWQTP